MSNNDSNSHQSSRPITITVLALFICVLGIGQTCLAGFLPSVNTAGIVLGISLFLGGVVILSVKALWPKEFLGAYMYFLAGTVFLITAINGALGLGIAQHKVPSLFGALFVIVGLVFFFLGWLFLKKQPDRR
ncbi:MAG: hypothetical protein L6461_12380 [Anaerolineae bacterium]|jgi:hypothetical protein|nr:hypothetical protein [Anaerolineae bacterium]